MQAGGGGAAAAAAPGTPSAAARQQLAGLETVLTEIMDGRTSGARKREIGKSHPLCFGVPSPSILHSIPFHHHSSLLWWPVPCKGLR